MEGIKVSIWVTSKLIPSRNVFLSLCFPHPQEQKAKLKECAQLFCTNMIFPNTPHPLLSVKEYVFPPHRPQTHNTAEGWFHTYCLSATMPCFVRKRFIAGFCWEWCFHDRKAFFNTGQITLWLQREHSSRIQRRRMSKMFCNLWNTKCKKWNPLYRCQ